MVFQKTCADCNFFRHGGKRCHNTLPRHIPHGLQPQTAIKTQRMYTLCLGTSRTDCNGKSACFGRFGRCFASAHPARIATALVLVLPNCFHLCLGTSRTDCNASIERGASIPSNFASAHPARIATARKMQEMVGDNLCLGTSRTDCNHKSAQGVTRDFVECAVSR